MTTKLTLILFLIVISSTTIDGCFGQTTATSVDFNVASVPAPPVISETAHALRDWDRMIAMLQSDRPPSDAQIRAFFMNILQRHPDGLIGGVVVCSAGFFNLSGGNGYSLVGSIDASGRHYCNDIEIMNRTTNGIAIQGLDTWEVDDIHNIVKDLRRDGRYELVVPTKDSEIEAGGSCIAFWTKIYVLKSGALVDKSSAFKSFYKDRLDALHIQIPQAEDLDAHDNGDKAICLQIQADKIQRFIGTSPTAGEEEALNWANSNDPNFRLRAISVFADIGDPQAIRALETLTIDKDSVVADEAKRALNKLRMASSY